MDDKDKPAPASVSPQATTGECAGVFDMIAARKVWWAALSDRGDPNQLTGTWDAFSAGYYAAFDEARRRQGGTAEGADWVRALDALYALAIERMPAQWRSDCILPSEHATRLHTIRSADDPPCYIVADKLYERHGKWLVAIHNAWPQIKAALSAAPRPDAGEGLAKRFLDSAKRLSALISIQPGNFSVVNDLQEAEWALREAARALGREEGK